MLVIDLTQLINEQMSVFPESDLPEVTQIATIYKNYYLEHQLKLTTHLGTHIDSPGHILKKTNILNDYDVSKFIGLGHVVDVTYVQEVITIDLLKTIPNLEKIEFLLFYTGLSNDFATSKYLRDFPVLSSEAIDYLVNLKHSQLKGIGVDCFSIDKIKPISIENHIRVLEQDLIIIENLRNLDQLMNRKFTFSCLPLKIDKIEGSPVRAVAMIFEE